jgi:hypothetical protein
LELKLRGVTGVYKIGGQEETLFFTAASFIVKKVTWPKAATALYTEFALSFLQGIT